jgi:hypothetical protein
MGAHGPKFLVLDFTQVSYIDATAVHSCFCPVARLTAIQDCKLVYAGCSASVESQLLKHGALEGDHLRVFPSLHRALDWCESVVIARARRNLARAMHATSSQGQHQSQSQSLPPPPTRKQRGDRLASDLPSPGDTGSGSTGSGSTGSGSTGGGSTGGTAGSTSTAAVGAVGSAEEPVLNVGTLLRQWLELRPEVPPATVRPWLFLGGAHHACDRALLDRQAPSSTKKRTKAQKHHRSRSSSKIPRAKTPRSRQLARVSL